MKDAILRAQALYKRQKFRLALEILESNAQPDLFAQLSIVEQMMTLDLLASLCEKQGFLNRARKYAVRMIRLKDDDPRGYLRLGKLLQLIPGKLGEAIQIYQRALAKVNPLVPTCQDFLKRQMSFCQAKQKSSSFREAQAAKNKAKCDPVAKLPHELLVLVFQQLSLRHRVKCTMVNKLWYEFLVAEPSFWSNLEFDVNGSENQKYSIVTPETVHKYCNRSRMYSSLRLDMQRVFVKDPKNMFNALMTSSGNHASRLSLLKFDTATPVTDMPVIRMVRHSLEATSEISRTPTMLPALRELRICSDTPERDIRWCLKSLPSLEVLDIVTTPRTRPEMLASPANSFIDDPTHQLDVVCNKLRSVSVLGRSGVRVLSDLLASQLVSLPSLKRIDLHRAVPVFWPVMHGAVANPGLERIGYTSEGIHGKDTFLPLPKFAGSLTSLTLNDLALTFVAAAPLLPDGTRYTGGSRSAMESLNYIELKRVILAEFNLAELINSWGCAGNLTTLVVHAFHTQSRSFYPPPDHLNFELLPMLETLQFTGMGNLTDDFFAWLINAFPNLRKVNLDSTVITGPKLVHLLRSKPKLQVVRCNNVVDLSADTVSWIRQLRHVTVTF